VGRRLRNSVERRVGGRARQLLSALLFCIAFAALVGVGYSAGSINPADEGYGYGYSTSTTSTSTTQSTTSTSTSTPASADLSIFKSGPASTRSGATIVYQIFVSNSGPSAASNVKMTDVLPFGTTFVSVTGTGWTCTGPKPGSTGTVNCATPSLASGNSVATALAVKVKARPGKGGTVIVNQATVTSNTPDPNTANNSSSASTQITK
jgi:uncharacterized repeat protein (TIGR01451 family)